MLATPIFVQRPLKALYPLVTFPGTSIITKWTASVNAEPGFLYEVLEALCLFSDEDRDVNLVVDAMSIKKSKIWNNSLGKVMGLSLIHISEPTRPY